MSPEALIEQTAAQCDALRVWLQQQSTTLADFSKRLKQINQQLRKNAEVRDSDFSPQFNAFVADLRDTLNKREPVWTELRARIRQVSANAWGEELVLCIKAFNNRAKALSKTCDEFESEYDGFCKHYKSFTAAKLNVWLLTSCQADMATLIGKIAFLAREIARKTDQHRSPYAK